MAKRMSKYANMTASDLARVTRERGLEKPVVKNISEWADWLEAQDSQAPETTEKRSAGKPGKKSADKPEGSAEGNGNANG